MSETPERDDRRSTPRELAHFVAEIEVNGEKVGCGVSWDASGAGLLMKTHLSIEPQTEIVLRLFVPREKEPRRLKATVLRCEALPPREHPIWNHRVAISLHDPSPELQGIVQSLAKGPPRTEPPPKA
jgi:hypothetical protein